MPSNNNNFAPFLPTNETHVITKRNPNAHRCVFVANFSVLTRFDRKESWIERQTHPLTYSLERVSQSLRELQVYSAVSAFRCIQIIFFQTHSIASRILHASGSHPSFYPSASRGHAIERVYQSHFLGAEICRSAFLCVSSSDLIETLLNSFVYCCSD